MNWFRPFMVMAVVAFIAIGAEIGSRMTDNSQYLASTSGLDFFISGASAGEMVAENGPITDGMVDASMSMGVPAECDLGCRMMKCKADPVCAQQMSFSVPDGFHMASVAQPPKFTCTEIPQPSVWQLMPDVGVQAVPRPVVQKPQLGVKRQPRPVAAKKQVEDRLANYLNELTTATQEMSQ